MHDTTATNRLHKKRNALMAIGATVVVAAGLAFAPNSATAAEDTTLSAAKGLEEELRSQAAAGDPLAEANLKQFESLSSDQVASLDGYLSGTNKLEATTTPDQVTMQSGARSEVVEEGDAELITTTRTEDVSVAAGGSGLEARAAAAQEFNVRSTAESEFKFAGISITKTRVWGEYVTGNNRVLRITDYGGNLVHNYDPTASVSVQKQSGVVSGGQATFKTLVNVKRGPIPYLGVSWSERSSYQYLTVNGPGVVSSGWTN